MSEVRCARCNRILKNPRYTAIGLGSDCLRKIMREWDNGRKHYVRIANGKIDFICTDENNEKKTIYWIDETAQILRKNTQDVGENSG